MHFPPTLTPYQFQSYMNAWSHGNEMDPLKIEQAKPEDVWAVVVTLVSKKYPVMKTMFDMLDKDQQGWMASMGYLYPINGHRFTFMCTAENTHMIRGDRTDKQFKSECLTSIYNALNETFRHDDNIEIRREDKSVVIRRKPNVGGVEMYTVRVSATS